MKKIWYFVAKNGWERLPGQGLDFGEKFITNILNWVYFGLGLVGVVMIVFAGFQYLTANGDPAKATNARTTIKWAVIGLAIVMLAAAITFFVANMAGEAK